MNIEEATQKLEELTKEIETMKFELHGVYCIYLALSKLGYDDDEVNISTFKIALQQVNRLLEKAIYGEMS